MTEKYEITLMGCDDYTVIEMDLSPSQVKLLKTIERKVKKKSTYNCMPVLELRKL